MKSINTKAIQNWVIKNYRFYDGPTAMNINLKENDTICSLEIEWIPAKRNAHPKIKAHYEGIYDETFFPLAKVHFDAQFLEKLKVLAPSLTVKFLHLLN